MRSCGPSSSRGDSSQSLLKSKPSELIFGKSKVRREGAGT
jgi:hypothetical protein